MIAYNSLHQKQQWRKIPRTLVTFKSFPPRMGNQEQTAAELCLLPLPPAGSPVDLAGVHFLSDPEQPARQPLAGSTLGVRIRKSLNNPECLCHDPSKKKYKKQNTRPSLDLLAVDLLPSCPSLR